MDDAALSLECTWSKFVVVNVRNIIEVTRILSFNVKGLGIPFNEHREPPIRRLINASQKILAFYFRLLLYTLLPLPFFASLLLHQHPNFATFQWSPFLYAHSHTLFTILTFHSLSLSALSKLPPAAKKAETRASPATSAVAMNPILRIISFRVNPDFHLR